jgi:two-component system chemotaxis response regulator CheY
MKGKIMPKVMLVDDDRTTVSLLQTLLELDGFDVVVSPRGQMAIDKASTEKPDVFMLDYHLTDMDGVTVVKTLRANPVFAKTPIVMASGLNVEDEALKAGASMFLLKPFEPGQLADIFHKLIG